MPSTPTRFNNIDKYNIQEENRKSFSNDFNRFNRILNPGVFGTILALAAMGTTIGILATMSAVGIPLMATIIVGVGMGSFITGTAAKHLYNRYKKSESTKNNVNLENVLTLDENKTLNPEESLEQQKLSKFKELYSKYSAKVINKAFILHGAAKYNLPKLADRLSKNSDVDFNAKNSDGDTPLHVASSYGNKKSAIRLLANGADINIKGQEKLTPLHFAAINGGIEMVKFLIDNGASIEAQDEYGRTPLFCAVQNGHIGVCETLLESDDSIAKTINTVNMYGESPIHWAIERQYDQITKLLTDKGANINIKSHNKYKSTPLHLAIDRNKAETVQLLMDNNADINALEANNLTPLHTAASMGYTGICNLLLATKKANVNAVCIYGGAPLHYAAAFSSAETTQALIKNGADINLKDKDGNTPLLIAILNAKETKERKEEKVKILLQNGADIHTQNTKNNTPLGLANKRKYSVITNLITEEDERRNNIFSNIASGVQETDEYSLRIKNKDGDTLLHFAAKYGNISLIEQLYKKNVDFNAENKKGDTPLHFAISNGQEEAALKLLENGADVNAQNKNGETPLHLATIHGHANLIEKLAEKGADVDAQNKQKCTSLYLAIHSDHPEEVALKLLENGANINDKDKNGKNPLHWAILNGRNNLVQKILQFKDKFGVDINAESNYKWTLLHYAAKSKIENIIEDLIEYGLDVDAKDTDQNTPLMFACGEGGNVKSAEELLNKGANIEAKNKHGNTPLLNAVFNNKVEAVRLLLARNANICAENNEGVSPFNLAVSNKSIDEEVRKLLLEKTKSVYSEMRTRSGKEEQTAAEKLRREASSSWVNAVNGNSLERQ